MSYLLDTNVLSEARRRSPAVMNWVRSTPGATRYCSIISLGEIENGIERRRRTDRKVADELSVWRERLQAQFGERALPVTAAIALTWGRIAAGRTRDTADALIAATAMVHDLTLVTRNVKDFSDLPITILNPWDQA